MKWLVTGCSGFVGTNIVNYLIQKNEEVIGIDIKKPKINNIKSFKFIKFDLSVRKGLNDYINDVDYVINLAAIVSIPYSKKYPNKTKSTNVKIFRNILHNINIKKTKCIIFASSSAIYGDSLKNYEKKKISNFFSAYAQSKYLNEIDAKNFYKKYKISLIGLRYFNLYGSFSNANSRYSSVIPKWINNLIKKKVIIINGDGNQSRDFVHVDDIVKINYMLAKNFGKIKTFKLFNIGSGKSTSLKTLLNYLVKFSKIKKYKIKFRPSADFGVMESKANIKLFKQSFKFNFTKLDKGLKKTIQFYER